MEVLQCDGCDFRAPSYEDLKAHIQDVHTAFLQPTDVSEETPSQSRFSSMNSGDQAEVEYSSVKDEFAITDDMAGQNAAQLGTGNYYSHSQSYYGHHMLSKPANKFFQCKFCVRYFRSKNLLIEHTRKVHGAQAGGGSPTGSPGAGSLNYNIMMHEGFGKVFSCQFCTYKSPRRARIIKHQKMYHKNSLKESSASPSAAAAISESASISVPMQDSCKELPAEVVERSILESMVKPLTKSRGNFCCEWCSYQTPRRERWCDHMMKKHRSMVKILSSLRQQQDGSSMQDISSKGPPSPTQNSNYIPMNASGREMPNANVSNFRGSMNNSLVRSNSSTSSKFSSVSYPHMKHKAPHNSGIVSMSDRSRYGIDMVNSSADMDTNSMLNDSSSDDELNELDSENGLNSMDHQASGLTAEQLMGSEGHKLLETKGIPFRRFMNRFQCPFCPFLTMHRRSISRHIENIHLSGKTAVYKCDECPFTCKSSFKLGAHKQCHTGAASDWDAVNSQTESIASSLNESTVSYEGGNINGRKSGGIMDSMQQQQQSPQSHSQHPYKCTMCNYSTTTLKGLRVHQQHKHSFCDNLPKYEGPSSNTPQESEPDTHASPSTVKKSQTSILGLSSKNNFVAKSSRKMSNDFPLDLSPVKKRTRIDEIASNLQSKINQNKQQEDAVINVEDDEEEEEDNEVEIEVELDKEEEQAEQLMEIASFTSQQMWGRDANESQKESNYRNIPHDYNSTNGAEIELTISEDEEDYYCSPVGLKDQALNSSALGSQSSMYGSDQNNDNSDYGDSGRLYYCKHCDFSNKSARSVSTHYQRMHPYIKFSFRYILDPNDHSAVYRCLECYIDYTNFEDLQQHYGEHHPEAMNVLNFDHSDLIYRCRFCSYTSPNVRSLMPHYQRMHPTVKINNAMIFSSYVVEQQEGLGSESQTLREILNSAPKSLATSTPVARGTSLPASFNKNSSKGNSPESDSQKESSVNSVVVYDCDVCSFASPNMHSVLVHYQKKHPEEKASYFRIQKTMRIVSVERGSALAQMAYELGSPVSPKMSNMPSQLPPPPPPDLTTELYYCKHCSYSNRSVVGVLVHYQKRHPEIKVTAKYIRQAPPTAAMMRAGEMPPGIHRPPGSMQQLNRGNTESTVAPLENEMFFCQHCDYGNRTVKGVLIHYQKKHRDFKANADVIRQHTATIRSLCDRGQKNSPGSLQIHSSNVEREKTKLRALKCRQCSYTSPYFYALRKHIKKDHPSLKATVTSILRWAFLDGLIEAGYHCEWCIYSHAEPSGLLVHYQRRHPEHYVDYTYMATKLWAGPDPSPPALLMPLEMKTYKCRDCIFEASSIWDITNHYQAFHPWAMNGDESVLLDIIKEKDAAEKANPASNDTGARIHSDDQRVAQAPQVDQDTEYTEDTNLPQDKAIQLTSANPAISSTPYQCTVCQSEYNNLHGLLTHYGKKHPGMKVKAADFAQDIDINPGAVYKCRHCPYINTRIHGVLTHYQKRHPSVKVTAEDFVHDVEQPTDMSQNDVEETSRIFKQGYGAYRCKLCPYTHGTLEKLKIHYEKYHNQPEFDVFAQSPLKLPASMEPEVVTEIKPSPEIVPEEVIGDDSVPPTHFSSSHLVSHTVFRCQLCKYFCSTRKGIARHYRIKHNNVRAQPEGKNNLFKCALCSYTNPIRKGLAAHYQKRHDIDAYYTHCLAASRTVSDKPNKVIIPSPPKEDSPQLSEELRRAVEKKKCSLCSFQSFSKKGIVSHYMKRHPGVFPKKQHASKLGGYFTAVYADEYEKPQIPAEERNDFEKPEVEVEGPEIEWLPFRCIKCFKLSFSTAELLCMHYTDHHSKDLKRDFTILGSGACFQNPTYQCKHCDSKLHSTAELTAHLNSHNEEFQKRAKRQERRKQLLSKQKYTDGALVDFKQERLFSNLEEVSKLKERKVVGYKCKFCVEVHPTLRAICNHLRKHVQYGNGSAVSAAVKEAEDPSHAAFLEGIEGAKDPGSVATVELAEADSGPSLEDETRPGGYHCSQCDRVLMSMQGLRSHERSHLALAMFTREDKYSCQYCSFVSAFRHNLDRHMQAHHGHHKPFRCKLCPFKSSYNSRLKTHLLKAHAGEHAYKCSSCSFSTMTISQLKEHSLKVHGKALTLPRPRTISLVTSHAQHASKNHTTAEEVEDSNDSSYSEPPDVQQQLNHYQSAALARNNISPVPLSGTDQKAEVVLNCEFCEFSSGYIQSIRRHYRDKHGGKKLFKCKDCSFYTGFKSAFTMHVEAGHSAVPEEGPKDLRCPLCLYHTKYKRNMIDHIVLHREERVVPIEVCRSKLSKYLQGIVFRCDKCTFTCSSDESLQQHIEKHNELRPYKCQLCYYETKHTEELDAHLRDEHKVSRNFELVGRVNLDQLEQMKGKEESSSSDEEEKEEDMSSKEEERESMRFSENGPPEKRFPCEFCGRSFAEGSEWERHVLRHGMALNETKRVIAEDGQLNESAEDNVKVPLAEEMESSAKIVVDFSHKNETAICIVAADDKSLQENAEAKSE
ncbi:zinc finger protein 462 isoform X3 [Heteronotia binoei]|uniref:zinc finger protein 462 isoform X3 n=1 Tax=Heteronotia binoei TaxID=13085 RepID=UPI00292F9EDA|nr:zinc finger protein 462 isoform X3 [Heteronotia binoei]